MGLSDLVDKTKYPNCYKAFGYADDILNSEILSCWQVFASCERFKRDITDNRFYFDFEAAERVCRIIQQFVHIKGPLANKEMILEPWQLFIYVNVFGFKWAYGNLKGLRRFKKVFNLVSRKNGKTAMSSPLGLYMMAMDGEEGAEIFSLASKKDQSRIVFDSAREQAKRSPGFTKNTGVEVFRHHIEKSSTASTYYPLSSDSDSSDGLSPHLVIFDEVHAFKDRNMYGVMETAIGARTQPLLWCISTAGSDTSGICYELQMDLEKVLKREYPDETQFGMIYTLDDKDDFRDERVWIKANPCLGVSITREYIQGMVDKAVRQPANKNNVLTKHFNVWCNAVSQFFDLIKWKDAARPGLKLEDFVGQKCIAGVDFASKIDLTSIVYAFKIPGENGEKDKYALFDRSFLPEARIEESSNAAYKGWVEEGWLIKTNGEAINMEKIEEDCKLYLKKFKTLNILYDGWNAVQFSQNMSKIKLEVTEVRMNTATLSNPMKMLDALIREGRIIHNGSPLFNWCLSNVLSKADHNDNHFPKKSHEKFKIDVAVAAILAIAGWIEEEVNTKQSVYSSRGIRTIM